MWVEISEEEAVCVIEALNERQGNYINGDGSPMIFPKPTEAEVALVKSFNRRLKTTRNRGRLTMYKVEEVVPGVPMFLPVERKE